GADDYVTKPFSMTQLHARIEAVLRRAAPIPQSRLAGRQALRSDSSHTIEVQPRQARALAAEGGDPQPAPTPKRSFPLGQPIHETRLSQGLWLHQVERACKIRWEFLQAIEQENWDYVPREELRRALRAYTSYLGLDLAKLINRPKKKPAALLFPF